MIAFKLVDRFSVILRCVLFLFGLAAGLPAAAATTGIWSANSNSGSASAAGITATISGYLGGSCLGSQAGYYDNVTLSNSVPNVYTNPYGGPVAEQAALRTVVCFGNANNSALQTKTVTVTFSKPVDNPVLHVARLGGIEGRNPNIYTNSTQWRLASSSPSNVTLSKLSGNAPLYVDSSSFVRSVVYQNGSPIMASSQNGDCTANRLEDGTACGSIQFLGASITSLTFNVFGTSAHSSGMTPAGGDALEMAWSVKGATITLQKQTQDGFGGFDFSIDNTTTADRGTSKQSASARLTTASGNNPAASQRYQVGNHGDAINLAETGGPSDFVLAEATCSYASGEHVGTTRNGPTITIPANAYTPADDIRCTFVNQRVQVTAAPDSASTRHGSPVDINVAGNDTSLGSELDPRSIKPKNPPANGSVVCGVEGDASGCRYTPNPGFSGEDTFTYEICDNTQPTPFCGTAEVTVAVGPDAVNDSASGAVNQVVSGNAATNDKTTPGSTFIKQSDPKNGTVTMNPDGSYAYLPNPNFVGEDSFTYQVCMPPDPQTDPNLCDTATVTIKVEGGQIATQPDHATTPARTPVVIDVAANDSSSGSSLNHDSIKLKSGPSHGTVVCDANGCTYRPDNSFSGEDRFRYEICDSNQPTPSCKTEEVRVIVGPDAKDDSASTPVNTPENDNAATNDVYAPNSVFKATSNPVNGTVSMNGDGTYTYTPHPNYVGEDSFTYQVCLPPDPQDDPNLCDTATVKITVNGGQITTAPDEASTSHGQPVTIDVVGNDSSSGTALDRSSTKLKDGPAHGSVTCDANGCIYTPDEDFSGVDDFTYEICDSNNPMPTCATETVRIKVGPKAVDDEEKTKVNTPLNDSVTPNDVYGPDAQFAKTSDPTNGTVTMNADGTYTYTPNENFVGEDRFTYEVCMPAQVDSGGSLILLAARAKAEGELCSTATVKITIVGGDVIAEPDTASTPHDTPIAIDVTRNDSSDGSPLDKASTKGLDQPANGSVTCNANGCTYTPRPGFSGEDNFTYQICDSSRPTASCDTAVVTVKVGPKAVDDNASTSVNMPVDGNAASNDAYGPGSVFKRKSGPVNGTVVMNPDGSYTYEPDENFVGEDSFTYEVCLPPDPQTDPHLCSEAIVHITVDGGEITAGPDSGSTPNGKPVHIDVEANDSSSGTPLDSESIKPKTPPANGTLSCDTSGCTYTPSPGFSGEDRFSYEICDTSQPTPACSTGEVTVRVGPRAEDDSASTPVNTPVSGDAASNDASGPGSVFKHKNGPRNGTVTMNPDGSYSYTPNQNYVGDDSFTYEVCLPPDPQTDPDLCSEATVHVTVTGGTISAAPDHASTPAGTPVTIDVAGNDSSSGAPLDRSSVKVKTPPGNGSVSCDAAGCTYTPQPGFSGQDRFSYEICDGSQPTPACTTGEVTVTVGPKAMDDGVSTTVNHPVSGNAAENDIYGPGAVFRKTSDPVHGRITMNPDGSFEYTPEAGFVGQDSFTYEVCSGASAGALTKQDGDMCSSATVTITVEGGLTTAPVPMDSRWLLIAMTLFISVLAFKLRKRR